MLTERRPTKSAIRKRVDRRFGPTFGYPVFLRHQGGEPQIRWFHSGQ